MSDGQIVLSEDVVYAQVDEVLPLIHEELQDAYNRESRLRQSVSKFMRKKFNDRVIESALRNYVQR